MIHTKKVISPIVVAMLIGSCGTSKKLSDKSVQKVDSTYSVTTKVDSSNKTTIDTRKETTSITTFTDWFWTDSSKLNASVQPTDSSASVIETETIKIIATKKPDGSTNLDIVQKPQKAYGKGTNTTTTRENTSATSESNYSGKTKQAGTVDKTSKAVTRTKHREGLPGWATVLSVLVVLGALIWFIWYLYNRAEKEQS